MAAKVSVSEKPWSDYTAADYSIEQWHAACLIHQHEGAPTSKSQCKLPVKTPNGTLSRAGVHAAAGALAGARGGVNASSSEKAAAAKALVRYYGQLDETPPPSINHSLVDKFFAHFGVKGMKWGVRRENPSGGTGYVTKKDAVALIDTKTGEVVKVVGGTRRDRKEIKKHLEPSIEEESRKEHLSVDAERLVKTTQKQGHEMSDREIKEAVNRARMVQDYDKFFGDSPNKELQQKVDALKLQKEYSQLRREMNPTRLERATSFAKKANTGYKEFKTLDDNTGGLLSKSIAKAFKSKSSSGFKVNPVKVNVRPTLLGTGKTP